MTLIELAHETTGMTNKQAWAAITEKLHAIGRDDCLNEVWNIRYRILRCMTPLHLRVVK